MPETDSDVTANLDLPASTDVAADTAHFRAFATRREDDVSAPWPTAPTTPKRGVLAVAVVVVVILAITLVALLLR